ncbi:MAG: hypothetical protein V7K22_11480 [Nostoc sp.]|uniref:hypothetical protein n=1 Tax=Nostoc sp. TaxID=1180 RepID=UPI002FFC5D7D
MSTLNIIWSALISDPIKTIGAFTSTGALIIGWMNLKKDTTKVSVVVKRAHNGPLILQRPQQEFLLFEIYNQGISPVVINQVGIRLPRKNSNKTKLINLYKNKFINLVDLPYSYLDMRGQESAIGTLECVGVPGTVPAKSTGIFLLDYSRMRETSIAYQQKSMSPKNAEFVGSQRAIKAFQEFQNLEMPQGKRLQITPYVLTGSGEKITGKKTIITLGNLGDAIAYEYYS